MYVGVCGGVCVCCGGGGRGEQSKPVHEAQGMAEARKGGDEDQEGVALLSTIAR